MSLLGAFKNPNYLPIKTKLVFRRYFGESMIADDVKENTSHIKIFTKLITELEKLWPNIAFAEQNAFLSPEIKQAKETVLLVNVDFEFGYLRHYQVTEKSLDNLVAMMKSESARGIRVHLRYR
jgi:hypothetical protein